MRAVDTNVLIRLVVRDNEHQYQSARSFVMLGAWVSVLALAETIWGLDSIYGFTPGEQADAVEMFLNHDHLTVQDSETVATALALFRSRPALSFSDCLLLNLARKAGHMPLGTFDRALSRVEGAHRL